MSAIEFMPYKIEGQKIVYFHFVGAATTVYYNKDVNTIYFFNGSPANAFGIGEEQFFEQCERAYIDFINTTRSN